MNSINVTAIIPAYKPDDKLIETLRELSEVGFSNIIVVDDGSGSEYTEIFAKAETIPGCILLRHDINRGKGAALKTAFSHFAKDPRGAMGVVTADADGQHRTDDICAVSRAMCERAEVVLGVRDFSDPSVPPRSRSGNRITSTVFRLFFGMKISDTQTGLRAIPSRWISEIMKAAGDRYEYETNMLFLMNKRKIPYSEVKIATVYIEENKSSHFRVVRDSILIYSLILKYLFSSIASALTDEVAYFVFRHVGILGFLPIPNVYASAAGARIISSAVNYAVNSRLVFGEKMRVSTLVKYYILAIVQLVLSATLVFCAEKLFAVNSALLSTIFKTVIDTLLFFVSFRIQHKWVFASKERSE